MVIAQKCWQKVALYLALVSVFDSCGNNDTDIKPVLGVSNIRIIERYYFDYSGISSHGELFDFQGYTFDSKRLKDIISSPNFKKFPNYEQYYSFYKDKLIDVRSVTWKKTPAVKEDIRIFNNVFQYNNLLDYEKSRDLAKNNFLTTPGNYYAYFSGYPSGVVLYILIPEKGQLFLIRKRG